MESLLLTWMRASRGRQFDLIIAGRLSGLHGWKRTHVPIAFQVIDSTIVIHFDGSERLTISNAVDIDERPNGELLVGDASEVRFTWCSERDPDKDCEETFWRAYGMFSFNRTDDLYTTAMGISPSEGEFVALR